MPPRYGYVVQENITVRMPANGYNRAVEPVPGSSFGTGAEDEKGILSGGGNGEIVLRILAPVWLARLDYAQGMGGFILASLERCPAGGAVLGVVRVGVAAMAADCQIKPFALPIARHPEKPAIVAELTRGNPAGQARSISRRSQQSCISNLRRTGLR